jgi:hypothetical protein
MSMLHILKWESLYLKFAPVIGFRVSIAVLLYRWHHGSAGPTSKFSNPDRNIEAFIFKYIQTV